MQHSEVLSHVISTLKRYEMLPAKTAVLAGFSGGADSVTLLSVLHELSHGVGDVPAFPLYACHVHHGIRGAEADRDEQFCRAFCEERGIPFTALHADVPKLASARGESLETCGRKVRYAFFEEVSDRILRQHPDLSGVRVATAHTASDNAETVLFHLARGTGLAGLTGIPPVRGSIIRPLIDLGREDIEAYCADLGLSYMTDSTNDDVSYARNRIRHEVLPALEAIHHGATGHIARTAATLQRDADCFDELAERLLQRSRRGEDTLDVSVLREAPDAVLIRTLALAMKAYSGVSAEQRHLEDFLSWIRTGEKFKQMQVPGGAFVTLAGDKLLFHWPKEEEETVTRTFRRTVTMAERLEFVSDTPPPVTVRLTKRSTAHPDFDAYLLENSLIYDKINFNFVLRTRQPGDTFAPNGRGVTKKLKTLYQEAGVSADKRADRVILEQNGQIAWLEGFGAAEGFAPSENDRFVWIVEVIR
ncbi:MAG: tRNA lysidine(34) synthetase TilS [Clostridia bacterium]|nr:tRNA lysidine(34) synthetase TilS [Clostridia bacterium]